MESVVTDLRTKLADARLGGGEKAVASLRKAGKKTPRERCVVAELAKPRANRISDTNTLCFRLNLLLDPNTPFLELSSLAAHDLYPGQHVPGAGIITGVGRIAGKECMIVVNDATTKGGAYYPMTVKKHLRAQEIAKENGLPCVYLGKCAQRLIRS